jgi:O-antigen ligase
MNIFSGKQNKIRFNLNTISEYLFYTLIAVLFFSTALMNILCGLILMTYIINCFISKKVLLERTILDIPILLFVLAKLISVFASINFQSSFLMVYKELPYYFLFFILNTIVIKDYEKIYRNFLRILLVASFIASLVGIGSYAFKFSERAISTSSGYITLGIFLTVSLSVFLFLQEERYLFKNNLIFFSYIIVLLTGILFTFNRTHWVAAVLLIIIYTVYKKKYFYLLAVFLIISVIIIFIPSFQERFFQLVFFWKNMSDRDIIWKSAFSMIFERPISGFGPNTFDLIFQLKNQLGDKLVSSWHNEYLQIYMDSGIIGILSLGFLIFTIYYNAIKFFRTEISNRMIIIPVISAMSFLFVFGGFSDYLSSILFKTFLSIFAIQITLFYKSNKYYDGRKNISAV